MLIGSLVICFHDFFGSSWGEMKTFLVKSFIKGNTILKIKTWHIGSVFTCLFILLNVGWLPVGRSTHFEEVS